jgi:hypothetical protein
VSGRPYLLALAIAVGGCDGEVPDTSDELFLPDAILEVAVTMDPADFETLRRQVRTLPGTLQGDCLAQPFASPFTRFHADVTVDGRTYRDVAIRKKGFLGSGAGEVSMTKPALKLKSDYFVDGQRFGGRGGIENLVLNNSVQDPSYLRNCLAYQVFTAAGIEAPRCHFAHVTVNGEDLGLYVHVEDLDDEYLERRFDDPGGTLHEGTLSDFRTDWLGTFELEEGDGDAARLAALAAAIEAPDATRVAEVSALVDLDHFLTFWAAESLLAHWDGYTGNTNNFFVYDDPATGLLTFLPWGTDQVMQPGGAAPISVQGTGALANRLYALPEIRTRYVDALRALLATAWDEAALGAEIDRVAALIAPYVDPATHPGDVAQVRGFVDGRRAALEAELAAGPAPYDQPLRGAFCMAEIGRVTGTFSTTWGTAGGDPWASGTGTLTATVSGASLAFTGYGAVAGVDPNDPNLATIQLYAQRPDGRINVAIVSLRGSDVAPSSRPFDWTPTFGALYEYDPANGSWISLGAFGLGQLDLTAGAASAGAPVTGTIDADLVDPPW